MDVGTDFQSNYYAYLPLAIQSGSIYTLSADLDPTDQASSGNLRMGFSSTTDMTTPSQGPFSPSVRYRRDGEGYIYAGATLLDTFGPSGGSVSDPIRATLTLDTTGSAYTTTWTITNISTSTVLASDTHEYTTNPTITQVFFGASQTNGTFDNFELTAVPEPSSLLLMGGGFLALVAMQRMRRSRS
jgi:hypothetical protein